MGRIMFVLQDLWSGIGQYFGAFIFILKFFLLVFMAILVAVVGAIAWVFERLGILWVLTFFIQLLLWPIARLTLYRYGRLSIKGCENIKGIKGGAIFAANHISELDPFLVPASLSPLSSFFPMFYVSRERNFYEKRGLKKFAYGGFVFRIFGAFPALVGIKDFASKLKNHTELLLSDRSLCIFPEGEIKSRNGAEKRGKPGVAYLLWATGVPIVPVAVYGHGEMSRMDFLSRRKKIGVSFGKPITREEIFGPDIGVEPDHDQLVAVAKTVMDRIQALVILYQAENEVTQSLQVTPDQV